MTATALLGLALLVGPFAFPAYAWIQYHRSQPALPAPAEPTVVERSEVVAGSWEPAPWMAAR